MVVTSVMAVKATPKALQLLDEAKEEKGENLTKFEVVKTAAPSYIPAVVIGVSSLLCIFGANALNKRQQAALTSAYALLNTSYKDYKRKVKEMYGTEAEEQVREELAKDVYEKTDISVQDGKQLFYDEFSKRYFESTINEVQSAEYHINRDLSIRDYAVVNEFYDYLGLDHIPGGDELGWSTGMNFDYYWQSWLDFGHNKIVMEDGRECYVITMFSEPDTVWSEY